MRKLFIFPKNKRAQETTVYEQVGKIVEEAKEIDDAFSTHGYFETIVETWDCICACEGLLRKFHTIDVIKALAMVKIKGIRRGDWIVWE